MLQAIAMRVVNEMNLACLYRNPDVLTNLMITSHSTQHEL